MKQVFALTLVLFTLRVYAQKDPVAIKYAETITTNDLKNNLSILASDALEGRETGKRGQKMAAAFIASYFQEIGLAGPVSGGHYQQMSLYAPGSSVCTLKSENLEFTNQEYFYVGANDTGGIVELPLVFAGKGSDEELAKLEVKDKAVMILPDNSSQMNNPAVRTLRDNGARIVLIVAENENDFNRVVGMTNRFSGARLSLVKTTLSSNNGGSIYLLPETAGKLFKTSYDKLKKAIAEKKTDKIKPVTITYSVSQTTKEIKSENVLGFLEGSDKKDEVVVVTAHYDHIGILSRPDGDRINNGADDDGSGTVAVLALANAFAQAKRDGKGPRRSILFMTVTGEEKGLLGSQYYTDNPVFSLDNTVVDLNIDMIGRKDPQHKTSVPYVYVIGSDKLSSELHALSERVNQTYTNLIFDYTYNDPEHPDRLYYRSDHWNFAKKNIPIIFYFDGIHEDYHKPSDEVNKIEFDLLSLRAKTIFYTAWQIANMDNRLVVDKH